MMSSEHLIFQSKVESSHDRSPLMVSFVFLNCDPATIVQTGVVEIKKYVSTFADAARKAVHESNFDGVELHACHGSLLDQFLQEVSNNRTDEYGGSIENRARFPLEVIDACIKAIGPSRLAVRLSPWNTTNGKHFEGLFRI